MQREQGDRPLFSSHVTSRGGGQSSNNSPKRVPFQFQEATAPPLVHSPFNNEKLQHTAKSGFHKYNKHSCLNPVNYTLNTETIYDSSYLPNKLPGLSSKLQQVASPKINSYLD